MPYDVLSTDGRRPRLGTAGAGGEALFQQVTREPRLSDKVAEMMLETILSRRLQVGDRLPSERELGEQFNVSRTVVREAVRALVAKGVIEVRSGSGLRVAAVDAAAVSESMSLYLRGATLDFEKVHEVRALLEVHIAGLAAERATEEDIGAAARRPRADAAGGGRRRARGAGRPRVPPGDRARDAERPLPPPDGLDRLGADRHPAREPRLRLDADDARASTRRCWSGSPRTIPTAPATAMAAHLEGVARWWREHAVTAAAAPA